MERITSKKTWEEAEKELSQEYGYSHIWKRLNQIENILGDAYDLDRLQKLITADMAGKIVILKYAPGQLVYKAQINPGRDKAQIFIEKCQSPQDSMILERSADVFESLEMAAKTLCEIMV